MTRDDIIKMAKQAGLLPIDIGPTIETWQMRRKEESLVRFAELVAAHEREACANLLLNVDLSSMDADHRLQSWTATVLLNFSDAIRARGEQ
jgi:Mg-chelatase subunit ChlD